MRGESLSSEIILRCENIGNIITRPFERFVAIQASSGIVMLVCALLALIWANSSASYLYEKLFHSMFTLGMNGFALDRPLHFWINEGLMACFFFAVGLEIKREVLVGELSSFKQLVLPAAGAVGGMVVPATIYFFLNNDLPTLRGWAIPMATDIAFVIGALALLGTRVPSFLPVFLVSLAIVDDLGAVLVIATFYTDTLNMAYLLPVLGTLTALITINIFGFRHPLPYLLLGVALWLFVYRLGVHATIAGVLAALTVPARSSVNTNRFIDVAVNQLQRFRAQGERYYTVHLSSNNQGVVQSLRDMCTYVEPPLQRIEHSLHPWVFFGIMPLFALANSGVHLGSGSFSAALMSREALGIILGLFLGKQIGILGAAWLCIRSGLATLPEGIAWRHIYGGSVLCGIGFTMSLFISDLSFSNPEALDNAKIGILLGSTLSGVVGLTFLFLCCRSEAEPQAQETPHYVNFENQGDEEMLKTRVMLVDDEEAFVSTMEKRLKKRGMDVLTAFSGEEALQKLKNEPIVDVIVLDLRMPGMHGIETLNEIKKLNPLLSVIILTGHGSIDSAVDGLKTGAFDYMTKPCDVEELTDKIEQAKEKKRGFQQEALLEAGRELRGRRGV
jgi:NhaA family Na+:H+ antiporter